MGRRKKESQPPIKLVIGRSPEQKKGQDNANYAVLNQSAPSETTGRPKRRASNTDFKKFREPESDDDDLEIIQVYKPPAGRGSRSRVVNQLRNISRPPLIMDCIEEELSPAQKQAIRLAQAEHDKAKQKINQIKRNTNCTEIVLDSYVSPQFLNINDLKPAVVNKANQRSSSPDVMIVEGPTNVQNKTAATTTTTAPRQAPTLTGVNTTPRPIQPANKPLPMLIRPNTATQMATGVKPQDTILLGPNGIPLVIPTQFVPKGNQPIVLQANQTGCLQVVGSGGQTGPMLGTALITSSGKMAPPLAPKMTTGTAPPNFLPPPPPLQCMGVNGQKRPSSVTENIPQPPTKRSRGRKKIYDASPLGPGPESELIDIKNGVNWVPLDEYYYSKKEGDPTYREEKGEYRFKCFCCNKMLYNNLRTMMHVQGHIDSDKQQNLDLSDLTQCKYCYKQFDTPFDMQCHIEKIHQNRSNVLVCRICEKDHTSQSDLKHHMRIHNACEMPYTCQLCNFRSSVYDDVVDHFKKRHDSSRYLVCLYCLKIFEVRFAKTSGWGMTQHYYQHLLKHQNKASKLKCSRCKLLFISKQELQLHKNKDHLPNYKGTQSANSSRTVNASSEQVMICVPSSGKHKVKSLNAPASQKQQSIGNCTFSQLTPDHICIECKKPMMTPEHYKKYTECSMCRFATICNEAFAIHMYDFHVRGSEWKLATYAERQLDKPLFCLCGYSSNKGNDIANHLVLCSKRTSYTQKPEVKWFEYDEEQEDYNPQEPYSEDDIMEEKSVVEKEVPSLFGALGLVKKPSSRSCDSHDSSKESSPFREPTPTQIAHELIEDVLDRIFPAEAASREFIETLLFNVMEQIDEIERCKFHSMAAIYASERKSVDDSCKSSESSSSQRWEDSLSVDDRSESTTKSMEFTGISDDQVGAPDMSWYMGTEFKHEESSVDSDLRTSTAASVASENKESLQENVSTTDWSLLDTSCSSRLDVKEEVDMVGIDSSPRISFSDQDTKNNLMDVDDGGTMDNSEMDANHREADEAVPADGCLEQEQPINSGSTQTNKEMTDNQEDQRQDECMETSNISEALQSSDGHKDKACLLNTSAQAPVSESGRDKSLAVGILEQPPEVQKCDLIEDSHKNNECDSSHMVQQLSESETCAAVSYEQETFEDQNCELLDDKPQAAKNQEFESVGKQELASESQNAGSPHDHQKIESLGVDQQTPMRTKNSLAEEWQKKSQQQGCDSVERMTDDNHSIDIANIPLPEGECGKTMEQFTKDKMMQQLGEAETLNRTGNMTEKPVDALLTKEMHKDATSSRNHHSHSRDRYDDCCHHFDSHSHESRHKYEHSWDHKKKGDRSSGYRSHSRRRSYDRDRNGRSHKKYQDYHDHGSKSYHGNRDGHYDGDRRNYKPGNRESGSSHYGKRGYY